MWRERKEKKRKEVRGDRHIKVVEVRSLKLDLEILWKDLGVKLGEVVEDYRTLLFSNFQKKRICFVSVMSFWKLCARFVFWSYLLCLSFFGFAAWDLIDHIRIYVWDKFHVIWICIERDPSIWSFSLSFEVSFFWKWYLFIVIINRAEILSRYKKHISYVSPKISKILELLRASCKSFCVQVPVWGDFKEVTRSLILWS